MLQPADNILYEGAVANYIALIIQLPLLQTLDNLENLLFELKYHFVERIQVYLNHKPLLGSCPAIATRSLL